MITLTPIRSLSDNYIWLLHNSTHAYAVDPGDATPLLETLKRLNLSLEGLLITHKHWDHTRGIPELLTHYPTMEIYGSAKEPVAGITHPVGESDTVSLDKLGLQFKVLDIPGHTLGHIAYYNEDYLLCGDTLFSCGCGRVFEGTMHQMHDSLKKLALCPPTAYVCSGHEYTLSNLRFCLDLEPDNILLNQWLSEAQALIDDKRPTLPVRLKDELARNPFLRCDDPALLEKLETKCGHPISNEVMAFEQLRTLKDKY